MAKDFKPIGAVIKEVLAEFKLNAKLSEIQVAKDWSKLFGPLIASRTEKVELRGKTLYITVNSAPLKQELELSKTQIIHLLAEAYGTGKITNVVIRG